MTDVAGGECGPVTNVAGDDGLGRGRAMAKAWLMGVAALVIGLILRTVPPLVMEPPAPPQMPDP